MRKVPTPSGPFAFQLYFEDLGEIDDICLVALKRQSLLPSKPAPIRIERFVEKEFKTALRYEDLGPDNLGCTIFNSSGAVEAILKDRPGLQARPQADIGIGRGGAAQGALNTPSPGLSALLKPGR